MKCTYFYSPIDEQYHVRDSNGIIMGSGATLDEAVENASFWIQVPITKLENEGDFE